MANEVNYQANWTDEKTQCKNCKIFQTKNGKNACVPPDKTFEQALAQYGEAKPDGHCNFFQGK